MQRFYTKGYAHRCKNRDIDDRCIHGDTSGFLENPKMYNFKKYFFFSDRLVKNAIFSRLYWVVVETRRTKNLETEPFRASKRELSTDLSCSFSLFLWGNWISSCCFCFNFWLEAGLTLSPRLAILDLVDLTIHRLTVLLCPGVLVSCVLNTGLNYHILSCFPIKCIFLLQYIYDMQNSDHWVECTISMSFYLYIYV